MNHHFYSGCPSVTLLTLPAARVPARRLHPPGALAIPRRRRRRLGLRPRGTLEVGEEILALWHGYRLARRRLLRLRLVLLVVCHRLPRVDGGGPWTLSPLAS